MKKDKTLPPVRPNVGLEALYRRKLRALISEMHNSVNYWVIAAYRAKPPEVVALAQDESPAASLRDTMKKLASQWEARFDEAAEELARYFAKAANKRSDYALQRILKKGGFAIEFKMTRAMNDVLQATIGEQVALIKSIPAKYLLDVQGAVMRAVQTGGDLGPLTVELQESYGVAYRRAAFIARDQNNKATASMTKARQSELGIETAKWKHSGGGRHPRPSHVKADRDGVVYNVREGWYDPHLKKRIWPGTEPNCIPGDTLVDLVNGCHVVWRYHYRGDLITFDAGKVAIRTTPNHPFLTSKGWVGAEALQNGDYVWQARHKNVNASMANKNQTKFCIADVFDAFAAASPFAVTSRLPGAVFNFHGDIPNTEVETVRAEFGLLDEVNISSDQRVAKFNFAETDAGIGRIGSTVMETSHARATRGFCDSAFGVVGSVLKPEQVSLGTTSWLDPFIHESAGDECARNLEVIGNCKNAVSFFEHSNNIIGRKIIKVLTRYNSSPAHDAKNHFRAYPESFSHSADRVSIAMQTYDGIKIKIDTSTATPPSTIFTPVTISAEILAQLVGVHTKMSRKVFEAGEFIFKAVRVSKKRRSKNSGTHVYTLQSNVGWYSMAQNDLVCKNCRCVSSPIIPGFI